MKAGKKTEHEAAVKMKPLFKNNVFVCSYPKAMWNHNLYSKAQNVDGVILPLKHPIHPASPNGKCEEKQENRTHNLQAVLWVRAWWNLPGLEKNHVPITCRVGNQRSLVPALCGIPKGLAASDSYCSVCQMDRLLCWSSLRWYSASQMILCILWRIRLMGGWGMQSLRTETWKN